jgi:hypothetical protein
VCLRAPDAQAATEQGRSIGTVSTVGNVIVVELTPGALGTANPFDLDGRTLRFTPAGSRYRVERTALHWYANAGAPQAVPGVTLRHFAFPFSGKAWTSFAVGMTGSLRFGTTDVPRDPYGRPDGGVVLGRFDALADAAATVADSAPAICVFLKPRMSGKRYVNELADRVVITWDLTEPYGSLLDFSWTPTTNRFQAALHRDGTIEMSYRHVAARDAIVGIYPALTGAGAPVATMTPELAHHVLAPYQDVRRLRIALVGGSVVSAVFETRGPLPAEGDRRMDGLRYRLAFSTTDARTHRRTTIAAWAVEGMKDPYDPNGGPATYVTSGRGASQQRAVRGDTVVVRGILPRVAGAITVTADVSAAGTVVQRLEPRTVRLPGFVSPIVHFGTVRRSDAPYPFAFEAFHYLDAPRQQDVSCTVIGALGDRFDFLVPYADFRIDDQEASSPSFGPASGTIRGIGQAQHDLASYCTRGRFQWGFAQPVSGSAIETDRQPPRRAPRSGRHDLTAFLPQLAESSPDRTPLPYNYAVAHIGHEISHRWGAYVSAKVAGARLALGPWPHWDPGLQTRVAFPYELPTEASTLGGGAWQANGDGTYTRLHDGFLTPATGYSYLDLYLMGFLSPAEVPDFFLLRNLKRAATDAEGRPVFEADRTNVTIRDVIAASGPRVPDAAHSQRTFNTGIVVIVEHGHRPSRALMERAGGIGRQWVYYWDRVTGHRASMTTSPR